MSASAAAAEYTADELARAADTMTTTVRMYQARGLLQPPAKRGRVAVYAAEHLMRLRLIADLQRRGHSLAGIKELLDNAERGIALPELLGIRSWAPLPRVRLTPAEFVARFAGATIEAPDMLRAVRLGVAELDGDAVLVDERFLQVGTSLVALGIPVGAVLDEWQALSRRAGAIARQFAAVFETHLWPALDARAASLAEITAVLDQLAPLAQQVTALALEAGLREAADRFVGEHASV
ncbi:MAG: MerR family transcriptional regulator [Ilumatobacteraceae bacterium]